jgi:YjbE family integral membrane protein
LEFGSTLFWVALGQIIIADILLSGDNAVVIALAARSLPAEQQKRAILIGSGAAILMRVALTLVAAQLLQMPWLKLIGGVLLLYVGISLLLPEDEGHGEGGGGVSKGTMAAAVRTILIADLVMSLDNVIAVAAASKGSTFLLIFGLALSIPLMIWGSTFLLKIIERFPIIVWLGAALLGFIAGEIIVTDPAIAAWVDGLAKSWGLSVQNLARIAGVIGAALVAGIGYLMVNRRKVEAL